MMLTSSTWKQTKKDDQSVQSQPWRHLVCATYHTLSEMSSTLRAGSPVFLCRKIVACQLFPSRSAWFISLSAAEQGRTFPWLKEWLGSNTLLGGKERRKEESNSLAQTADVWLTSEQPKEKRKDIRITRLIINYFHFIYFLFTNCGWKVKIISLFKEAILIFNWQF